MLFFLLGDTAAGPDHHLVPQAQLLQALLHAGEQGAAQAQQVADADGVGLGLGSHLGHGLGQVHAAQEHHVEAGVLEGLTDEVDAVDMGVGAHGGQNDLLLAGRGFLDVDGNVLLSDGAAGGVHAQGGVALHIAGDAVGVTVGLDKALQVPAAGAGGIHHAALAALDDQVDQLLVGPLLPELLGQAAGLQGVGGQMQHGLQHGEGLVHHHGLVLVDLGRLDAGVVGAAEHVLAGPDGLAHGVAGGDAHGLSGLGTVEIGAAQLGSDGHAGKVGLLGDQVGGGILEGLGHHDQALGKHVVAEGTHDGQVAVQVDAAHVHLDAAQTEVQAAVDRQALGQQAHGDGHAVGAADVVDVLVGIQLGEDVVLAADLDGLVAVDHLGAEVMDAAAAEVHVDDGADVGAVKAGDQGVQDVDVGGIAGGVDTHGMLGAAAHLDELALALGGDAALAAGLLDQLTALQGVDVTGGLGVDELENGVVVHVGILVDVAGLFPGLLGGVAAQDGVQAGDAGLQSLLAQLINAVAAADHAGHLAGVGCGQANDLAVFVQIGHFDTEAVRIGADGFNVFLDDFLCSFLHVALLTQYPAQHGRGGSVRRTPASSEQSAPSG